MKRNHGKLHLIAITFIGLIVISFISCYQVNASTGTEVSGLISVNTTWSPQNGPYMITGDVCVDKGAILNIEAGTEIIFNGDYYLKVDGTINANGISQNRIKFISNNNGGKIMLDSDNNSLNYSSMSGMVWGVFLCDNSSYNKIDNCVIRNNVFGIYSNYNNSFNEIKNCSISENSSTGIQFFKLCTNNVIDDCTIFNQKSTDSMNPGCGIHFDYGSNDNIVKNSFIFGNNCGVDFYPDCTDNSITNNDIQKNTIGINFQNYGWKSSNLTNINNNNICNNYQYNLMSGHNDLGIYANNNYWGTLDENQINSSIYDFYDDFDRTKVLFKPFLINSALVTRQTNPVMSISLSESQKSLNSGASMNLIATVSPIDATNSDVSWSSSDTSVATVDNAGNVTAVGKGTATIKAITADGGYTESCIVTVSNYTVTFNSQDGDSLTSKIVNYNNVITAPSIPTRKGYIFGGWYKEAGCINAWDFETDKVTSDTALYAKWTSNVVSVSYQCHVQNIGWQTLVSNGAEAGTDGKALRVEALKVNLTNAPAGAHVDVQAHVQSIGWQNIVKDGQEAGTDAKALRVEALKLTLENMPGYSIQYRTHVQNIG